MDRTQTRREILSAAMGGEGGVDLHAHTTSSDGHWTPEGLVDDAAGLGIRVLAVTDHDTVAGIPEAQAAAQQRGVALIPGVEVTLRHRESAYHLLCYDVDPTAEVWADLHAERRRGEQRYYRRLLAMIREAGYAVRDEAVLQENGTYRPHPATGALQAAGYATSYESAQAMLKSLHLVYPSELLAVKSEFLAEVLDTRDALCVVAHAARSEPGVCVRATASDVAELRDMLPLVGLESYHPYHSESDVAQCLSLCDEHGLSPTAGSDAHGWNVRRPPKPHPAALSLRLLEMVRERWG
jgi:predicted metal-dependent phosphoesterase TrpH